MGKELSKIAKNFSKEDKKMSQIKQIIRKNVTRAEMSSKRINI